MTSRLLMAYNARDKRAGARTRPPEDIRGSTRATAILDHDDPLVGRLAHRVLSEATPRDALRSAHRIIAHAVRPVYSVEDRRPVSRTLRLGRGSCSQRMATLEAVARAVRVRTRVRGLLVDGTFWYPRFPHVKPFVPEQVLLAWPEFRVDGTWLPVGELFNAPGADGQYTNKGGETLFDAVARTGITWDDDGTTPGAAPISASAPGATASTSASAATSDRACAADGTPCDLSAHVTADLGHFDDRDELFRRYGQTLCWTARALTEPILGRWSAGTDTDRSRRTTVTPRTRASSRRA
ncbi:transglutaminase domain-containing protein [Streptomyces ipomoeae]|uniref:Transglutaminase domain-containing protein n=1 Tax=Streptomyces ipomoeae TaxID=103232 RepID=A0AAE8W586_9ACTN|nr:transglutaminase domain-containing protein [Streptomyces ipomoeae]TQE33779.1 transglutaminase domain-containing protein [Streptomyces ipomoeae]